MKVTRQAIPANHTHLFPASTWLVILCLFCIMAGGLWTFFVPHYESILPLPQHLPVDESLRSGTSATMDSSVFTYSPGWQLTSLGADPAEPANPWREPAGVVTFDYVGNELWLQLAVGAYWGYLYITVDGEPANRLSDISGNVTIEGNPAGYRTFYVPEQVTGPDPVARWLPVHSATGGPKLHTVRVEVWRSWGQTPLRAVAVDLLESKPWPQWPGMAAIALGTWGILALFFFLWITTGDQWSFVKKIRFSLSPIFIPLGAMQLALHLAFMGILLIAAAMVLQSWILGLVGLLFLGYAGLLRPESWVATLLFGLPFYFSQSLPLLPGRQIGLIDIGVLGGVVLVALRTLLLPSPAARSSPRKQTPTWYIAVTALTGWALVTVFAAEHFAVALREWRTIFLTAWLFGLLIMYTTRNTPHQGRIHWLLLGAWIAGGTVVSAVGIGQYFTDQRLITAEDVWRIRAFYGSPNNLALYIDRTLPVTLALALFLRNPRQRLFWGSLGILQLVALLLTYSKGSIFLALPAALAILWLGGTLLIRKGIATRASYLWLGIITLLAIGFLAPSLDTVRFQNLLELNQGTGRLRIQLWRSGWQMALDHPFFGVGPDNFLYAYRSLYILPEAWQEPNLNHPHNWLLDWWTRLGIPGLGLGLLFWGGGIMHLWRRFIQSTNTTTSALCLGLLAATMAGLAHGLIDVSYALPDLMLVWVFLFALETEGMHSENQ